jgi:glycosyltransferase involved in cell wall biosynthesis
MGRTLAKSVLVTDGSKLHSDESLSRRGSDTADKVRSAKELGLPEAHMMLTVTRLQGALPIDRGKLLGAVPDRKKTRRELRSDLGIPQDAFVVMFSGKFSTRKSPIDLIAAAHRVFQKGLPVWSLLVGDGVELGTMEEFSQCQGIRNSVVTGFVNQSSIPAYPAAADVTAITSFRDSHPLVVTEGISFGLPVIVSDRVGCIGPVDQDLYRKMSLASCGISETQDVTVAAQQLLTAALQLHSAGPRSSATRNRRSIAV